jgi:hypothetical protein
VCGERERERQREGNRQRERDRERERERDFYRKWLLQLWRSVSPDFCG